MLTRSMLFASFSVAASLALMGCDPPMPGVAGTVTLDSGVDASQFKNIELRAVVAEGDFDPKKPVFPSQVADAYQNGEGATSSWVGEMESSEKGAVLLQLGQPLEGMKFPFDYSLGGEGIGYTEEEHWRLFVWLSDNADSHLDKGPASGEPYGFVDFDAKGCGLGGGYCGVQEGIDLTVDKTAP